MGLSSFNAMRAREKAKLQAQAKVEEKTVETKTESISDENLIESEERTEKKKTDAEKLNKKRK